MQTLEKLRQRMMRHNLSDIARRSGIHYTSIHAIAKGKRDDIWLSNYGRIQQAMDEMESDA